MRLCPDRLARPLHRGTGSSTSPHGSVTRSSLSMESTWAWSTPTRSGSPSFRTTIRSSPAFSGKFHDQEVAAVPRHRAGESGGLLPCAGLTTCGIPAISLSLPIPAAGATIPGRLRSCSRRAVYPESTDLLAHKEQKNGKNWTDTRDFVVQRNLEEFPRAWVVHEGLATRPSRHSRGRGAAKPCGRSCTPRTQSGTTRASASRSAVVAWVSRDDLRD